MAIATYSDLQTAINLMLSRPDMVANVPNWIYLCEQELSTILHRREMTQRATAQTVANQEAYALPNDFGEAMALHINSTPIEALDPSNWDRIKLLYTSAGTPVSWSITQNQFLLGPTPDGVYTIELYYYKTIPNLTGSSPTNWLLTTYPKVYLYGALSEAASSMVDEPRAQKWQSAYRDAIKAVLNDQVRDRGIGGGPLLRADLPFGRRAFNINTGV